MAHTLFVTYPRRAILGATLMITQSFLYNAIFFTYALVLTKVYGVSSKDTPYYFMFFALGNLIGPLTLGRLFDTIGRRRMIVGDVPPVRIAPHHQRDPLRRGRAQRDDPDGLLVRHLLLRVLRRQCRLPDGQRDLPGRGPRQGDRRLLRHRTDVRCHRALAVRNVDRQRSGPLQAFHRLPDRCRRDDRRRRGGDLARRGGRTTVARGHRAPTVRGEHEDARPVRE